MSRQNVSSGSYLEPIIGFSRAVRIGNHVSVGGTAPIGKDKATVGVGDAYVQTKRCLEIIETALQKVETPLTSVVRTRILLTDIELWEEVAKAHGEAFSDIKPVTTVAEVSRFVDPDWLVEIEVDAIIEE